MVAVSVCEPASGDIVGNTVGVVGDNIGDIVGNAVGVDGDTVGVDDDKVGAIGSDNASVRRESLALVVMD